MSLIALKAFRGMVPRFSDRLLESNQARRAWNCRITSGRLDPVSGLGKVSKTALGATIKTLYRYRHYINGTPSDNWLVFADDVDVVMSPLANDSNGRFYYTSDAFEPRVSDYATAIAGAVYPAAWYALGIPNPTAKPTVSVAGGSGSTEDRAYAYTFVTPWGEESGPSPASNVLIGGFTNGTWNVANIQTAPPNTGTVSAAAANTPSTGYVRVTLDTVFGLVAHEHITLASVGGMTDLNGSHRIVSVDTATNRVVVALATSQTYTSGGTWARVAPLNTAGMVKRIYRSAGTSGQFLYVAEIPAATTTYADTVAGTNLGELIVTTATLPPPKNLTSIRALPNGSLVGLAGNELCFSDPYMPYSWPQANRYSFSGVGVDLCVAGSSVIVLTDGFPILFTGTDPGAMSPSTMETYAPCVSKRGVADVGGGCIYPSHDGLWLANPSQVIKLTQKLFRAPEWSLVNPSTFHAAFWDGQYMASHDVGEGDSRILVLDVSEPDSIIEIDESVDSLLRNEFDGRLYVTQGATIYEFDADDSIPYSSDWMSRVYQMPAPTTFNCAQVFADFGQITPVDTTRQDANAALQALPMMGAGQIAGLSILGAPVAGSLLLPVAEAQAKKVQITLFVGETPVFTKEVGSQKPFRLPTGYKAELFAVQISASVPTYTVALASSMDELKQVAP